LRAAEGVGHPRYLLRLADLELIEREWRLVERRIKQARFPTVKSLDSFDFAAIPSLNKTLVLELARGKYIARRENVIAVGNSGTGKTHIALGLGWRPARRVCRSASPPHRGRHGPRADRGQGRQATVTSAAPTGGL
jgi:DNA replication protein DnaC